MNATLVGVERWDHPAVGSEPSPLPCRPEGRQFPAGPALQFRTSGRAKITAAAPLPSKTKVQAGPVVYIPCTKWLACTCTDGGHTLATRGTSNCCFSLPRYIGAAQGPLVAAAPGTSQGAQAHFIDISSPTLPGCQPCPALPCRIVPACAKVVWPGCFSTAPINPPPIFRLPTLKLIHPPRPHATADRDPPPPLPR